MKIIKSINNKNIHLIKCRGEGHDEYHERHLWWNSKNQAKCMYVQCAAPNLNLVVNGAVKEVKEMQTFLKLCNKFLLLLGLLSKVVKYCQVFNFGNITNIKTN